MKIFHPLIDILVLFEEIHNALSTSKLCNTKHSIIIAYLLYWHFLQLEFAHIIIM